MVLATIAAVPSAEHTLQNPTLCALNGRLVQDAFVEVAPKVTGLLGVKIFGVANVA
jgi:hypothetical protein